MLAMISLYRLPEFVMGPMANPYYHDLGLSKDAVGAVRGSIGLVGVAARHRGGRPQRRSLRLCPDAHLRLILQSLGTAAFALLAYTGPDLRVFGAVMAVDNFGAAFAGVALVTYMSSLTSLGYTATQYALLSSAYTYVGQVRQGILGRDGRIPGQRPDAARGLRACSSSAPACSASRRWCSASSSCGSRGSTPRARRPAARDAAHLRVCHQAVRPRSLRTCAAA